MRFGVVAFPGSNCDHDAYYAVRANLGQNATIVWHESEDLSGVDAILLPGGFSYGDYLRPGAIARFSPIIAAVKKFSRSGGLVIGICNGFQILLESGLLPGALVRNYNLRFVCKTIHVKVGTYHSPFTNALQKNQPLAIPIAHGDGCYYADKKTLNQLEKEDRIAFSYCDTTNNIIEEANPNGSTSNIAGILSEGRNILGMMPHPERAADPAMGSTDGLGVFQSMKSSWELTSL